MIPGALNHRHLAGGDPCERYQIKKALRHNLADGPYVQRTPTVSGNLTTWTFGAWVKRSDISGRHTLFSTETGSSGETFDFFDDYLRYSAYPNTLEKSSGLYRDAGAHMYVQVTYDTTNPVAADRVRLYTNGMRITSLMTNNAPAQNTPTQRWNVAGIPQIIGRNPFDNSGLGGLLSSVHFVDGLALEPSAFGFFCPSTGQWRPKKYRGAWGVNGFMLDFSDSSSATSTAIGADRSGNGNNWSPTGFTLTPGAGCDWVDDTPSNNFCTWDFNSSFSTLTEGGLVATTPTSTVGVTYGTQFMQEGSYFECVASLGNGGYIGLARAFRPVDGVSNFPLGLGSNSVHEFVYSSTGQKVGNGSAQTAYGAPWVAGDVIGVHYANGNITFYKNGVSQGVAFSGITDGPLHPACSDDSTSNQNIFTANFGQQPQVGSIYYPRALGWYRYAPPSNGKSLCTKNMPRPLVIKPTKLFLPKTYLGNGGSQVIGGMEFAPDLTWIKNRALASTSHQLYDTLRGATKVLNSDTNFAEAILAQGLTAFNANGFSVGSQAGVNGTGNGMVSWNWKRSPSAGVDILRYTGDGNAATTYAHNLGVAPNGALFINLDSPDDRIFWHRGIGVNAGQYQFHRLNTTGAAESSTFCFQTVDAFTSTNIKPGSLSSVNGAGVRFVVYLFADVPGFSKLGSYVGNGSANGTDGNLSFRPAFLLIKRKTVAANWILLDASREAENTVDVALYPNTSGVEVSSLPVDFLSNGFKIRTADATINASGEYYTYTAFAEFPFKYANAR